MKLNGDKLKRYAEEAGVSREELADAVTRAGLSDRESRKAVGNWLAGRDQPRCKAQDVAKLAEAVGRATKDLVSFVSVVSMEDTGANVIFFSSGFVFFLIA